MGVKHFKAALCALGIGAALASAPASAITYFSPITSFEDDDLDYVFDNDNSGTLSIGDRLVSVIEWNQTVGVLPGQNPTPIGTGEVTGIADVTIVNIIAGTYILAPTNDGVGEEGILAGFADGTAVAVWHDATPDLNVFNAACGTRAQCYALAGLGGGDGSTLLLTAGFFGDADASWVATPNGGGGTIATVENGGASSNFGSFSYALDIGVNNTGLNIVNQPCAPFCAPGGDGQIEITGSGNILGGQNLNHAEWTARSDADFQIRTVPEPGSLALFGAALAALALRRRKA